MVKIKDVVHYLNQIAPPSYQESYDNAGLITGHPEGAVEGILITLDATEEVIEEAIAKRCSLVVAHHPIVFKGLKKITGKTYVERVIIKAIKNDIAIFAAHTNLDSVAHGVNHRLCRQLQLNNTRILAPKKGVLTKIVTYVPKEHSEEVLTALHETGVGNIGNYKECSFRSEGTGTFSPNEDAEPYIGRPNTKAEVLEERIEAIFPSYLEATVVQALKQAHPYEEVAYYLQTLNNHNQEVGSGMIGKLDSPLSSQDFLKHLKTSMNLQMIRHTQVGDSPIQTVAVCGGSGSFLLPSAIAQQADAFVSADFKYHEFFDADEKLMIADIGHYESEVFTKDLFYEILSKKFTSFALCLSETITNPIFIF